MTVVYLLLLIIALVLYWAVSLVRDTAQERHALLVIGVIGGTALGLSIAQIQREWDALPEHIAPPPPSQPDITGKLADLSAKLERIATAAEATRSAVEGIRDKPPAPPSLPSAQTPAPPQTPTLQAPTTETCPPPPAPEASVTLVALSIEDAGSARRLTPLLQPPAPGRIVSAGIKFCPAGAQETACIDGLPTPNCPPDANLICRSKGLFATIPAAAAAQGGKFCIRIDMALQGSRTETVGGGPIELVAGATWPPGAASAAAPVLRPSQPRQRP